MSYVSLDDLRAEVLAAGLSPADLARALGWTVTVSPGSRHCPGRVKPDSGRVARTLGLRPYEPGHGYTTRVRTQVREATAVAIKDAIQRATA